MVSSADELRSLATPVDLASIDGEVLDLKSDGAAVFALVRRTSTYLVQRFSKTTGAATTLVTLPATTVSGFALDETAVYLLERAENGASSIVRASKSGGPSQVVARNLPLAAALEVDATHLYFIEDGGNIDRVTKGGGAAETFTSTIRPPVGFAVDADAVYWVDGGEGNPATGCNAHEGVIYRQPKRGGSAQAIVTGETCPMQVALDGTKVYWSTLGGSVRSAERTGGLVSIAAPKIYSEERFAVSRGSLAFLHVTVSEDDFTKTVAVARKSPASLTATIQVKTSTTVAHNPYRSLGAIAIDASATYYVEHSARQAGVHPSGDPMWSATGTLKKVSAF